MALENDSIALVLVWVSELFRFPCAIARPIGTSDKASEGPVAAVHWLAGGPGLPVDHVFGWDYFLSYTGLLQYENVIFLLQYENVIHRASGSRIPV